MADISLQELFNKIYSRFGPKIETLEKSQENFKKTASSNDDRLFNIIKDLQRVISLNKNNINDISTNIDSISNDIDNQNMKLDNMQSILDQNSRFQYRLYNRILHLEDNIERLIESEKYNINVQNKKIQFLENINKKQDKETSKKYKELSSIIGKVSNDNKELTRKLKEANDNIEGPYKKPNKIYEAAKSSVMGALGLGALGLGGYAAYKMGAFSPQSGVSEFGSETDKGYRSPLDKYSSPEEAMADASRVSRDSEKSGGQYKGIPGKGSPDIGETKPTSSSGSLVSLKEEREKFAKEIENDPVLKKKIFDIAQNEQGGHPEGTKAILETMMNRAHLLGLPLKAVATWTAERNSKGNKGYYDDKNGRKYADPKNPVFQNSLNDVLGGSNVSKFATDNSSTEWGRQRNESGRFTLQTEINKEYLSSPGWDGPVTRKKYLEWVKTHEENIKNKQKEQESSDTEKSDNNIKNKIEYTEDELKKLKGVDDKTKELYDKLQTMYGSKLTIESGYRDPQHNKKVGGAEGSQHLEGKAIDIKTGHLSKEEKIKIIKMASALGYNGIGVYNNNIHIDTRSNKASWGPDYHFETVPDWAKEVINDHIKGKHTQDSIKDIISKNFENKSEEEKPKPVKERGITSFAGMSPAYRDQSSDATKVDETKQNNKLYIDLEKPPSKEQIDEAMKNGTKKFHFDPEQPGANEALEYIKSKGGFSSAYMAGAGNPEFTNSNNDKPIDLTSDEGLQLVSSKAIQRMKQGYNAMQIDNLHTIDNVEDMKKIFTNFISSTNGKLKIIPNGNPNTLNRLIEKYPQFKEYIAYSLTENLSRYSSDFDAAKKLKKQGIELHNIEFGKSVGEAPSTEKGAREVAKAGIPTTLYDRYEGSDKEKGKGPSGIVAGDPNTKYYDIQSAKKDAEIKPTTDNQSTAPPTPNQKTGSLGSRGSDNNTSQQPEKLDGKLSDSVTQSQTNDTNNQPVVTPSVPGVVIDWGKSNTLKKEDKLPIDTK